MLRTDDARRRTPDDGRWTMDAGRWTMDAGPSTPYYKLTGELKSLSLSLKSYSSYMCDKMQPKLLKLWGIPSQGS